MFFKGGIDRMYYEILLLSKVKKGERMVIVIVDIKNRIVNIWQNAQWVTGKVSEIDKNKESTAN